MERVFPVYARLAESRVMDIYVNDYISSVFALSHPFLDYVGHFFSKVS